VGCPRRLEPFDRQKVVDVAPVGIVNLVARRVAGRIPGLLVARWEGLGLVGAEAPSYRGFRYPAEIIAHCVWLYHRFPLELA
jgi:hypothetical protein